MHKREKQQSGYSPVKRRLEGGMGKFHRRQAKTNHGKSVAVCGTMSEEIPAASCSSSIQAVDDNEETNSSNGEAQILSEVGITCCQLALSERQNKMLKSKMRILDKQ